MSQLGIEAVTPEEFMGDVIGDLNGKRGQIQEMNDRAGAVITAMVPLSEMLSMRPNSAP